MRARRRARPRPARPAAASDADRPAHKCPVCVCCTLNRPSTMPSLTSGMANNEPVSFSVGSARCSNSGGACRQSSTSSGSARAISQPNRPASMDFSRGGMRTCWRSCTRISSRRTLAIDEHEIQLIETEQRTRLREDALGEIVHAARTLKLEAGLEHARERPALGLHRIAMRTDAVEAQHEQQHQAREQPEHRACCRCCRAPPRECRPARRSDPRAHNSA